MPQTNLHFLFPKTPSETWLFRTGTEAGDEAAGERDRSMAELLENPQNLTIKGLREIERNADKLSAVEKRKLNELAEFELSLLESGEDKDVYPSRMLFHLMYSPLFRALSPNTQKAIRITTSKQYEELSKFVSEDSTSWSPGRAARAIYLFRYARGKGKDFRQILGDETFRAINEKLVTRTHKLLENIEVNQTQKKVRGILGEKITTTDRLFLMEMYNLFPNSSDWVERGGTPTYNLLRKACTGTTWDIVSKIGSYEPGADAQTTPPQELPPKTEDEDQYEYDKKVREYEWRQKRYEEHQKAEAHHEAQKAEYLVYWELIDEMTDNRNVLGDIGESLTPDQRQKIETFTRAGKSVQFLSWLESWGKKDKNFSLLPSHLKTLKQISEERLPIRSIETKDELLRAEIADTFSDEYGVDEFQDEEVVEGTKDEKEIKTRNIKEEIGALQKLIDFKAKDEARRKEKKAFEAKFKSKVRDQVQDQDLERLMAKYEEDEPIQSAAQLDEKLFKDQEALNGVVVRINQLAQVTEPVESGEEVTEEEKAKKAQYNRLNSQQVKSLLGTLEAGVESLQKNPLGDDFVKLEQKQEEEIQKLLKTAISKDKKIEERLNFARLAGSSQEKAQEYLAKYKRQFEDRLDNHQLTASDMAVIMEGELDPEVNEIILPDEDQEGSKKDYFKELRNFRSLLAAEIEAIDVSLSIDELNPGESHDRFKPWIDKIEAKYGYENIFKLVSDEGGGHSKLQKSFEALTQSHSERQYSPMTAKSLIDATVFASKDLVRHKINQSLRTSELSQPGISQQFLRDYEQQKGSLYDLRDQSMQDPEAIRHQQYYIGRRQKNAELADKILNQTKEALEDWDREGLLRLIETKGASESPEVIYKKLEALYESRITSTGNTFDFFSAEDAQKFSSYFGTVESEDSLLKSEEVLEKFTLMKAKELNHQALNEQMKRVVEGAADQLGVEDLNTLFLQISPFTRNIGAIKNSFEDQYEMIRSRIENSDNGLSKAMMEHSFFSEIEKGLIPQIEHIRSSIDAMGKSLFPEPKYQQFLEHYLSNYDQEVNQLKWILSKLREHPFDMWEEHHIESLKDLHKKFTQLFLAIDPQSGEFENRYKDLAKAWESVPEAERKVKNLGLYEPGKEAEFLTEKTKEQAKVLHSADRYKSAVESSVQMMEKDLNTLSDDDFSQKHSLSKTAALKTLDGLKENLENLERSVGPFRDPSFFSDWLTRYKDPNQKAQALHEFDVFDDLVTEQGELDRQRDQLVDFAKSYRDHGWQQFYAKFPRCKLNFREGFSILELWKMFEETASIIKRRHERFQEQAMTNLGKRVWRQTAWGKEFNRIADEKEDARISDHKNVHQQDNYALLRYHLQRTKYQDEGAALVELLIEKGYMRWDDTEFLKMLMRFDETIKFYFPDDVENYVDNPAALKLKIGDAVSNIWDHNKWLTWKSDMTSKYESEMSKHKADYTEEVQKGSVDTYLTDMLTKWANGHIDQNFERAKFEAYINFAFENGEMNGYPNGDRRWFYLIKGLTTKLGGTGETILSTDTLSRLGKLQGKMPYMDAFDDGNMYKKNGKLVPEGTPGAHKGSWDYNDVRSWAQYYEGISGFDGKREDVYTATRKWLNESLLHTHDAQDRMGKVQMTEIDRDDAGVLPLLVSPERLMPVLVFASGDKRPVDDKYYVNLLQSFKNNLNDTVTGFKVFEKEHQNTPGYQEMKETNLLRVGQMLRTYFLVSQTLTGNWDAESHVGAVTLSDGEWEKNDLAGDYENIINKVSLFFGGDTEVSSLKQVRNKQQEPSKSKDPIIKQTAAQVKGIYNSDKFTDLAAVENFIKGVSI